MTNPVDPAPTVNESLPSGIASNPVNAPLMVENEVVEKQSSVEAAAPPHWDRWMRVVLYGLAVALTSCLFAGWQQYSLILLKSGAYSWVCEPGDIHPQDEIPDLLTCKEQEKKVNALYALASGLELAGGVVAGVALDWVGPKLCAAIGSCLGFLSLLMLVYSSGKMNLLPLSMTLTGVAINLVGFPALTLEDYFPTAAATTAAYVIACQCLSSIVAPVLWVLWEHHPHWSGHQLWWGYLLVAFIPVTIPYLLLLPMTRKRNASIAEHASREKFNSKVLVKHICSLPYITMNAMSIILMLQTAYWQLIVRPELGVNIANFLGFTMPTQAIWALFMGRAADYIKTPFIIGVVMLLYSFVYLTVPAGRSGVQYLSVTVFNIALSYAYTVKYSYVQERYPQVYYGTLVGLSGAISGAGIFATNALNAIDRPVPTSLVLGGVSFVALPFCYWLHRESVNAKARAELHHLPSLQATQEKSISSNSNDGVSEIEAEPHHHVNPIEPLCTKPEEASIARHPSTGGPNV